MIDEFAKEYLHSDLRAGRATMLWKLEGLGEYDVRRPLTPTGTNLLGLIKHLTITEAWYFGEVFACPFPEQLPWRDGEADELSDDAKLGAFFDHKLLLADMWATEDESPSRSSSGTGACARTRTRRSLCSPSTRPVMWRGGHDPRREAVQHHGPRPQRDQSARRDMPTSCVSSSTAQWERTRAVRSYTDLTRRSGRTTARRSSEQLRWPPHHFPAGHDPRVGMRARLHACSLLVGLVLVLVACSGGSGEQTTPSTRNRSVTERASCTTASTFGSRGAENEIRGSSRDASLWGLALGPGPVPPHAGDELKIVWRMTGTGPLRVTLRAPDGTVRPLVFGPDRHGASNFDRPGDEWGTGIRFGSAGCWHVHLSRTDTSGDVWLDVAA